MPDPTTRRSPSTRPGWAARSWRTIGARPHVLPAGHDSPPGHANSRSADLACRFVAEGRYAFLLLSEAAEDMPPADAQRAWHALRQRMALVPAGPIAYDTAEGRHAVEVPAFYLDRHAVTNRQFQRFVEAGAYDDFELWPAAVWPSLMKFVDRTKRPGPRDWADGGYPQGKADHPVTGVCFYEAAAYADWVGKRLPTALEWNKAGGWPERRGAATGNRFPWGQVFEPERANLAAAGPGHTVPVDAYPSGATPNGLCQLTGNVWEWLADPLDALPGHPGAWFDPTLPLRRVIGGAYDTILPAEAACHFTTGQGELDRRPNLGFRCALSADRLRPEP